MNEGFDKEFQADIKDECEKIIQMFCGPKYFVANRCDGSSKESIAAAKLLSQGVDSSTGRNRMNNWLFEKSAVFVQT